MPLPCCAVPCSSQLNCCPLLPLLPLLLSLLMLLPQVMFPLQGLDLSGYVRGSQGLHDPSQAPLYDCYAVSNHYGGLGGGHYTAYGQMPDDKHWYLFDDSRVDTVQPEGVSGVRVV